MAVLEHLSRRPGEVCSRREILDAIWGAAVVSEEVLSQAVRELRSAFDDSADDPKVIETIPRGGYRLVARVDTATQPRSARRARLALAGLVTLAALLAALWWTLGRFSAPAARSVVAVLPFEHPQDDLAPIADGIADEITARISRLPGLTTVARTSAFAFRGSNADIPTIARGLDAERIVEGSVYRDGRQLRIHVQLVDARGLHLWSTTFAETDDGLISLFERVGEAVASQFSRAAAETAGSGAGSVVRSGVTENAFIEYLIAENLRQKRERSIEFWRASLEHYRLALDRSPDFAPAWTGLAQASYELGINPLVVHGQAEAAANYLAQALQASEQALRIDPDNARALTVKALLAMHADDWISADALYRQALTLAPHDADVLASHAQFLHLAGYLDEGLDAARRAFRLDPYAPQLSRLLASLLFTKGDLAESRKFTELTERLQDAPEPVLTAQLLLAEERYEEAGRALTEGGWADYGWRRQWLQPVLGAMAGTGDVEVALKLLQEAEGAGMLEPVTAAIVYAYLDRPEPALEALRGVAPFGTIWADYARGLRAHSRFIEVMAESGLVEFWELKGAPERCRREARSFRCG